MIVDNENPPIPIDMWDGYLYKKSPTLKMIYARTLDNVIGINGDLAVKSKEDMKWYKDKTENDLLVCGWNTYNSLPLGYRLNRKFVVLTKRNIPDIICLDYDKYNNEQICAFLKDVAKSMSLNDVSIIGGSHVYKQFENSIDIVYETVFNVELSDNDLNQVFYKFNPSGYYYCEDKETRVATYKTWTRKYKGV